MTPIWAWPRAAGQLILQSFRHPNTDKVIVVDEEARRVEVVSTSPAPPESTDAS